METKAGKLTSKTVFTSSNGTNNSRSKSNKWEKVILAPIYQHIKEQTPT